MRALQWLHSTALSRRWAPDRQTIFLQHRLITHACALPRPCQVAAKADEAVTIRFDAAGKPVVSLGAPAPIAAADEVGARRYGGSTGNACCPSLLHTSDCLAGSLLHYVTAGSLLL